MRRYLLYCLAFTPVLLGLLCPSIARAEKSFTAWLESYQAYDVLQSELSQRNPSADIILHRAELLLQSNNPEQALHILDRFGSFPSSSQEARRIWIRAKALRALNRPLEALFAYSKAAGLMDNDEKARFFNEEPDLRFFWKTTLKKWIFAHCFNGRIAANQGQRDLLTLTVSQAGSVWSGDPLWSRLESALAGTFAKTKERSGLSVLTVDSQSVNRVVQALAGLSIRDIPVVQNNLKRITVPELRQLWTRVMNAILDRNLDPIKAEVLNIGDNYPKYLAFQHIFAPQIKDMGKKVWAIGSPELDSWEAFLGRLDSSTLEGALTIISHELHSVLLGKETRETLRQYHFSYALMNGRHDLAEEIWSGLRVSALPLSLKLCGILSGLATVEQCFPVQENIQHQQQLLLSTLASATGEKPDTNLQLPFWVGLDSPELLFQVQASHSLDMLLTYAVQNQKWKTGPSTLLAKESALLFPQTSLGSKSLLYLARDAYSSGSIHLAWEYLQHMEPQTLTPKGELGYFQAKGGLLMDLGRVDESLKTYHRLLEQYPNGLTPEKRLKLALLYQRRGNWKQAQKMLQDLWEEHRNFQPGLQAEIMFWLAEGAQKSGDKLQALKHYLRLAWEFPKEHIWAVTALYRSALIYEQKGDLRTARKLLDSVLQKADRKSQKKAAQDRIEAIEEKLRSSNGEAPGVAFLF